MANKISKAVQTRLDQPALLSEKLKHYSTAPATGIPLLLLTLFGVFAFILGIGGFIGATLDSLWGSFVSPVLGNVVHLTIGNGVLANTVLWAIDAGMLAGLTVGVPYVLPFFLILSILEDSGYLNSVAFLLDRIMHRFGLHGRAIIPMIIGVGCNVPAIMGTRVLSTKRERIVASTLVALVPCSARTAVIMGAVAYFLGWPYALLIFLFQTVLIFLVGIGLNRLLPGQSTGLVMEMFPFRMPQVSITLKKTWLRFKDFVLVAFPILLVGSLVIGGLYETGYLWLAVEPLKPFTMWLLGLPAVAGLCLILGILRKELTLELLVALAVMQYGATARNLLVFMSPLQILTFTLVVTIYIPCVATLSVLARELGLKNAALITIFTVALSLLVGAVVYRTAPFFGLG